MNTTWITLIDRSRVYADDDHNENKGWIAPDKWMALMQVEYRLLYRQWLRKGLINVEPVDLLFKGPQAKTAATLPVPLQFTGYNAVIKSKTAGLAGSNVPLSLANTGTGAGTLINIAPSFAFPKGANIFQFQPGVTTWGNLDTALAGSTLLTLITASTLPSTVLSVNDVAYTAGGRDDIEGVLSILGVAELLDDGSYRPLRPQFDNGRKPFRTVLDDTAVEWSAFGTGDNLTVKLWPADTSASRTYVVRYILTPVNVTNTALTVELPYMGDERLVLGTLWRAGIKETARSGLVETAMTLCDTEMAFEAAGKHKAGGLVIKKVPRTPRPESTPTSFFSTSPRDWFYY